MNVNGRNPEILEGGSPGADELLCCAQYGGSARSSDPAIADTVNSLARLGCWITLANPVWTGKPNPLSHILFRPWTAGVPRYRSKDMSTVLDPFRFVLLVVAG